MKKSIIYYVVLFFATIIFTGCNDGSIDDLFPGELIEGCYIINQGSYGKGGSSISKYDYNADELTNFYYQQQNNGNELLSNLQYAYPYNDSIYLIGNSADQLITVNPFLKQSRNGVTSEIDNPRFCIANGDYLYISCLGASPDWFRMPDSYVAKFNMKTNSVEKIIALPGGPEGMEIAHGKLFVALNYKDSIAVIDISSEQISYIETPAVTSYFVKDEDENLYVTLVSTFTNFTTETGLGFINTITNELEEKFLKANISDGYGSVIQTNSDFSKIYVLTSSYDENWQKTGEVAEFDVVGKSFSATPFVSDVTGISGVSVNLKNKQVYVFSATSATGAGKMEIYSFSGEFVKEYEVGAFPVGAFYLD